MKSAEERVWLRSASPVPKCGSMGPSGTLSMLRGIVVALLYVASDEGLAGWLL